MEWSFDDFPEWQPISRVGGAAWLVAYLLFLLYALHNAPNFLFPDCVNLMMVVSDNTATNMVLDYLTTDSVNARMNSLGFKDTRIMRRIGGGGESREGKEPDNKRFGLGATTPHEMVQILERLDRGEIIGIVLDSGAAGSYNVLLQIGAAASAGGAGGATFSLQGNCNSTVTGAGTWGVLTMGGSPTNGGCNVAWSALQVIVIPQACTLKNLYYTNNNAAGFNASDQAVTFWTAPAITSALVASAITCTAGTAQACNDTTHTLALTAGSVVSVKIVTTGAGSGMYSVSGICN